MAFVKVIVGLLIRIKGNSKHTCGNLWSLLGVKNKDLSNASQMLLAKVKLCFPWLTHLRMLLHGDHGLRLLAKVGVVPCGKPQSLAD